MLNEGHIDLNSVQFCSDSLKGRLKQTMLNQELMFMGQVIELHRLYRIQTAMTDGHKQKGLDDYQPDTRAVNSSLNSQPKSFTSGMHRSTPGNKPKPLDLQLSADEFIRQSANAPVRGSFIEAKLRGHTMDVDLNLSLGRGEETSKKGEQRSWLGKGVAAREPPPEIIDLENPNSENLNHGFSSPISSLREKHVLKKSVIGSASNSAAPMNRPVRDEDRIFHRLMFGNSGLNQDTVAFNTPVPQQPMTLDLNVIQLDDQPDLTNTNSITFNSLVEAFHRSTRGLNLNKRAQTHDIGHMLDNLMGVNRTSVASNMAEDNRGKTPFIDLVSDSDSDESGVEHLSAVSDPKVESVGSSSLSNGLRPCGFEMGQAVMAESGLVMEPDPNPIPFPNPLCQSVYGVELYRTASDPKIESHGSSLKLSNGFEMGDAVVLESGSMVDPNPNPDPNPKPVCQNDDGVRPYVTTAYPKLDFGGSSSKLSNGLLQSVLGLSNKQLQSIFEKGKAVGPESGLVVGPNPNPNPVCKNDYGVGPYIPTAYPKLDFGGSSSKLSNVLLQSGFEKGKAVGPESGLVVGPNPKPVLQTESNVDHGSDPKIESLGSPSKLMNGQLTCGMVMAETVVGPEEDPNPNPNPKPLCENNSAVELTQNGSDPKLPCGFETDEMVGLESGFKEDPNPKPVCQNVPVTENPDSNTLILSKTEESESGEIEKKAAALLMQLSRDKSAEGIDFSTKLGSKEHEHQEQDQPQRSIDSYEAMVLNAKECGPEDYSISSNAFVVDVPQEKASDGKYKLKRGSRLKNFQKDVLSSLSSLSRHEIREDINIFDGVIRSREYKRMRANNKMLDETDWFIPKRSRRSRFARN